MELASLMNFVKISDVQVVRFVDIVDMTLNNTRVFSISILRVEYKCQLQCYFIHSYEENL